MDYFQILFYMYGVDIYELIQFGADPGHNLDLVEKILHLYYTQTVHQHSKIYVTLPFMSTIYDLLCFMTNISFMLSGHFLFPFLFIFLL